MIRPPLIGITTYHINEKGYVTLPAQYADAVRRAGGVPLLIQPGEERLDVLFELLDGIILSGGGDVDPNLYMDGAEVEDEVYWVDSARDAFEVELVNQSLATDKPLFCICRGLQILNVALGGTLIPHIPNTVTEAIPHRQPPRDPVPHSVAIDADSRLATMMGSDHVETASWHHQSIDTLAEGLRVVGRAPDGVIEAVEMDNKPSVIAVQWHPELTAAEDVTQQRLFNEFVRNTIQ